MTMRAKRLVTTVVALTLALGAIPAAAKHRSEDRSEGKLVRLAHDLRETTDAVYAEAIERRRHRNYWHWRALSALKRLDRSAHRFHRILKAEGHGDRRTRDAFRRLERSYRMARHSFPGPRGPRRLHREFTRVGRLMDRIDTRLARSGGDPHPHDSWRHRQHDPRHYGYRNDDGRGRWRVSWAYEF
jgi:hypothetical protein